MADRLPALIANRPLPDDHIARSLELRLATDWPESIVPLSAATRHAAQIDTDTPASARRTTLDAPLPSTLPASRPNPGLYIADPREWLFLLRTPESWRAVYPVEESLLADSPRAGT